MGHLSCYIRYSDDPPDPRPALAALMVMVADRGGAIREGIALGKATSAPG